MRKGIKYIVFATFLLAIQFGCAPKKAVSDTLTFELDIVEETYQKFDESITSIISKMTVEEKVGQMTQLNIDVISVGKIYALEEPHRLDTAKLREAIIDYGAGSILNVGGHAYDLEHWREIINQIQAEAQKSRLKIPVLYGIDAIHGANYLTEGTLFPQPLAQAATWNPELVKRAAAITAYETRASGIPWNFSPVLDLGRQPLWSRFFETYGEDVHLAKAMGTACVMGYQGNDPSDPHRVSACMKHFLGYSNSFTGKDRTPVYIHERQLCEYYLPTFQAAVDADALSVMINSGELNGIPVHADKKILTDLLRTEMGFDGVAVTDWEDIMKLQDNHRVAATLKDAVRMCINAGMDMSMTPNDYNFTNLLIELVNEGEVKMERINEAVGRILLMKKRLGLFENPTPLPLENYTDVGSAKHDEVSYQTAAEAITLLKNKGNILPLDPAKNIKLLVVGPTANSMTLLNGAWTRTWQGVDPKYDDENKKTIYEALADIYGKNLAYAPGCEIAIANENDISAAIEKGKAADVIILCLGEEPSTEKPGDIFDLTLSPAQIELTNALATLDTPMVGVLVENRPRIVSEIEPLLDAILLAYLPGDEGGRAVADILSGKINPSGKLPFTYPRYVNDLLTYDHKRTEELDPGFGWSAFNPQWEFGHGESYTNFTYTDISTQKDTLRGTEKMTVLATLTNVGKIEGKETVQLYINDRVASITPSVKKLRGFQKYNLPAGSSKSIAFEISAADLEFVNATNNWTTEEGWFDVQIGDLKTSFYYQK